MFGKYLLPIVLLVGVILFSSVLNRFENFEDTPSEGLVCPGCKKEGECICHTMDVNGNVDDKNSIKYNISREVNEGMTNILNMKGADQGLICIDCNKDKSSCKCVAYKNYNEVGDTSIIYKATSVPKKTVTTSTTPTQTVSTPGVIEPSLQGKHPIPYFELVDRVRKNEEIEEKQSKHIEDIRKVLADTITSLEKDDVLPSGSHCSCASAPVIDPLTGEVDLTEGCRPPGWLRMMNSRNARDEECRD